MSDGGFEWNTVSDSTDEEYSSSSEPQQADEAEERVADLAAKLSVANDRIDELEQELDAAREHSSSTAAETDEVSVLRARIDELEDALGREQVAAGHLSVRVQQLTEELSVRDERIEALESAAEQETIPDDVATTLDEQAARIEELEAEVEAPDQSIDDEQRTEQDARIEELEAELAALDDLRQQRDIQQMVTEVLTTMGADDETAVTEQSLIHAVQNSTADDLSEADIRAALSALLATGVVAEPTADQYTLC
jgi:chromosome segregation ATPase